MSSPEKPEIPSRSSSFPETHTRLLVAAAEGKWDEFFSAYLRPCWRSLTASCAARGLGLNDADDLLQELVLRIMRDGRFSVSSVNAAHDEALRDFRGNLAAKYLRSRESPLNSAKFRTYLKSVISHLLAEELRSRKRRPKTLPDDEIEPLVDWIDQSVSVSIDRMRAADALRAAVEQLQQESTEARTRGRRRRFAFLHHAFVDQLSPGVIAVRYDLDRKTVSDTIDEARNRILEIIGSTGSADETLAQIVASEPALWAEVLAEYSTKTPRTDA